MEPTPGRHTNYSYLYLEIGERVQALRQSFNVKHGKVPRRDFRLPPRAVGVPPLERGPLKGVEVSIEDLCDGFARAMGWDDRGRPRPERLRALGLEHDAAEQDPPVA